jgi:AhpD family alkylhydroperoxidase
VTWVEDVDGRGPLLPLRHSSDTDGEVRRLLEKFESRNNAPDILRLVANSERGFQLWVKFIDALMYRSDLPAADREVAVLRLAATQRSRYEWVEHEQIARSVGLSAEAIEAIADVSDVVDHNPFEMLTESQNLVITMVDSVLDPQGSGIDDEIWNRARITWGDNAAFDLLYCIGWWGGMVPLLIRMFRL